MNLKEEILSKMPDYFNELEKARYLYIELGKKVSFSTKFNNTDFLSMADMRFKEVDINFFNKNQVNCIMWSSLYSQLLSSAGIKNNIIKQGHDYVEFYVDGVRWCADATYGTYTDLARIHNDDETWNFGPAVLQKNNSSNAVRFDEETINLIKLIDDKIGYNNINKQNILELKDFLSKLKDGTFNIKEFVLHDMEIKDELIFSIEYLFSRIGILKSGYYESKDFTRELMYLMLNKDQLQKVKGIELKRTNSNKEVDIVQCICVYGKDKLHYYLLAANIPIKKVTEEEIIKLSILGYGIDEGKNIPGIDFPKNFIPGKISTNFKYKLQRYFINENLKVYDEQQLQTKSSRRH